MFVKKGEKIAVTVAGVIDDKDIKPEIDVIFIKPKMNFGDHQRFTDATASLDKADNSVDMALGSVNRALMQINIVGWQGPSFVDTPLTDSAIDALDMDVPLVPVVLAEITQRYVAQVTKQSPKGQTATSASGTGDSN